MPLAVSAQGFIDRVRGGVDTAGGQAGFSEGGADLIQITGGIIAVLLSFVGVILIIVMIYAGFLWMTAGGSADQVKKARAMILNAIIGLVITMSSYAISAYVLDQLAGSSGAQTGTDTRPTP